MDFVSLSLACFLFFLPFSLSHQQVRVERKFIMRLNWLQSMLYTRVYYYYCQCIHQDFVCFVCIQWYNERICVLMFLYGFPHVIRYTIHVLTISMVCDTRRLPISLSLSLWILGFAFDPLLDVLCMFTKYVRQSSALFSSFMFVHLLSIWHSHLHLHNIVHWIALVRLEL